MTERELSSATVPTIGSPSGPSTTISSPIRTDWRVWMSTPAAKLSATPRSTSTTTSPMIRTMASSGWTFAPRTARASPMPNRRMTYCVKRAAKTMRPGERFGTRLRRATMPFFARRDAIQPAMTASTASSASHHVTGVVKKESTSTVPRSTRSG
jgi:hypothetical protein